MDANSIPDAGMDGHRCNAGTHLTAVDTVVIARSLSISPLLFACLVPARSDSALASFALDNGGMRYLLAMRAPCPFVLRTNDGEAFCGLSSTRPICRMRKDSDDLAQHCAAHARVADRWNAIAAGVPSEAALGLADLCRYLMDSLRIPQ